MLEFFVVIWICICFILILSCMDEICGGPKKRKEQKCKEVEIERERLFQIEQRELQQRQALEIEHLQTLKRLGLEK